MAAGPPPLRPQVTGLVHRPAPAIAPVIRPAPAASGAGAGAAGGAGAAKAAGAARPTAASEAGWVETGRKGLPDFELVLPTISVEKTATFIGEPGVGKTSAIRRYVMAGVGLQANIIIGFNPNEGANHALAAFAPGIFIHDYFDQVAIMRGYKWALALMMNKKRKKTIIIIDDCNALSTQKGKEFCAYKTPAVKAVYKNARQRGIGLLVGLQKVTDTSTDARAATKIWVIFRQTIDTEIESLRKNCASHLPPAVWRRMLDSATNVAYHALVVLKEEINRAGPFSGYYAWAVPFSKWDPDTMDMKTPLVELGDPKWWTISRLTERPEVKMPLKAACYMDPFADDVDMGGEGGAAAASKPGGGKMGTKSKRGKGRSAAADAFAEVEFFVESALKAAAEADTA